MRACLKALFIFCIAAPLVNAAPFYVERVRLVAPAEQTELADRLADTLGNHYQVKTVDYASWPTAAAPAHDLVICFPNNVDTIVKEALQLPHIKRIILLPATDGKVYLRHLCNIVRTLNAGEKPGSAAKPLITVALPNPVDGKFNNGKISATAQCRLVTQALTTPFVREHREKGIAKIFQERCQKRSIGNLGTLYSFPKSGLIIGQPARERADAQWVWINLDSFKNKSVKPWMQLLLSRGYYIIIRSDRNNSTDTSASLKQQKDILNRLRKAGFNKSGAFITIGNTAAATFQFLNEQPDAYRCLMAITPGKIDSKLVLSLSRKNKPLFLVEASAGQNIALQRTWERGPAQLFPFIYPKYYSSFRKQANAFLRDGKMMATPFEAYAHRPAFTPAYQPLGNDDIVRRYRHDAKIIHRGNAVYMNGHFTGLERRWRENYKLRRDKDGKLSGPTLVFDKNHAKLVEGPTAPWGQAAGDLGNISVKIIDVTRNENDEKRMKSLIRDLTELMARSLRRANDNPKLNMGMFYNAANSMPGCLRNLARVSYLVNPDDAEELGRLMLIKLKDRWSLYPFQNMDLARATGALWRPLNAFRDDAVLLRFLRERRHYIENVIQYSSAITAEGGAQHHGLWHYSYAAYSYGSILEHARNSHAIGLYLSKESYRRLTQTGILGVTLGVPRYYGNIVPYNYNARTGLRCSAGAAGLGALTGAARFGDKHDPAALNPECLAYLAWSAPENGMLAQAREQNIDWSGYHPRLQRTVNSGAMAVRQYGPLQVSVSCMSEWYRNWVEVYNVFGDAGYGMYSKMGSVYLRTPDRDKAERYRSANGYDFSYTPGATSQARNGHEMIFRGVTGKFHNSTGIAGGTHLPVPPGSNANATDGMVAMDCSKGPAPISYKSYFFFGNRLVSLTSNIEPYPGTTGHAHGCHGYVAKVKYDDRHPIVTTLFQWKLTEDKARVAPGIKTVSQDNNLALDDCLDAVPLDGYRICHDQFGNAWVVHPSPGTTLYYRRGEQSYEFIAGQKLKPGVKNPFSGGLANTIRKKGADGVLNCYEPGVGRWERCWVKHSLTNGTDRAGLVWTLLVRTANESPDELVAKLKSGRSPYEIWRRDARAHILHDRESNSTGYAIFHPNDDHDSDPGLYQKISTGNPATPLTAHGLLVSASAPCFVMLRKDSENRLTISYANAMPTRNRRVIITLRGKWKFNSTYAGSDPATAVEVLPQDNNTTEVHFIVGNRRGGHYFPPQTPTMISLLRE